MIELSKEEAMEIGSLLIELDRAKWRMGFPPENPSRMRSLHYAKTLREKVAKGA